MVFSQSLNEIEGVVILSTWPCLTSGAQNAWCSAKSFWMVSYGPICNLRMQIERNLRGRGFVKLTLFDLKKSDGLMSSKNILHGHKETHILLQEEASAKSEELGFYRGNLCWPLEVIILDVLRYPWMWDWSEFPIIWRNYNEIWGVVEFCWIWISNCC